MELIFDNLVKFDDRGVDGSGVFEDINVGMVIGESFFEGDGNVKEGVFFEDW